MDERTQPQEEAPRRAPAPEDSGDDPAAGDAPAPAPAEKKERSRMLIPTLIMGALALVLAILAGRRGEHVAGLKLSAGMMAEMLPLLFFALVVAGMMQVLVPKENLAHWVGEGSGLRGILIGSVAGGLMPGGPYVSLPLAAGLVRSGAAVGTVVAFLTAWSLWAVSRLPLEVGILGWKLALVRMASTLVFPPIAGVVAQAFFGGVKAG